MTYTVSGLRGALNSDRTEHSDCSSEQCGVCVVQCVRASQVCMQSNVEGIEEAVSHQHITNTVLLSRGPFYVNVVSNDTVTSGKK